MVSFPAAKNCARLLRLAAPRPRASRLRTAFLCHFLPKARQSSLNAPKPSPNHSDTSERIEEETFDYYSPDYYYPVRFGETLHSRYKVVSKLGYGANSTVWLCRDLKKRKTHHVVVKVGTCNSSQADREIEVSEHLETIKSKHPGAALVRRLLEHFEIRGSSGPHPCLVYPVLGTPVDVLREMLPNRKLSEILLKAFVAQTLYALDFLHSEAEIVYTDLKADNLILSIGDMSHLTEYVEAAQKHSTPDKIDGDRFIYRSRDLIALRQLGPPVLCDFGEARLKTHPHSGSIMPYQYRAPEVLLGIPWDNKVDIWSIAMLTWHLLEDSPMFIPLDEHDTPSTSVHLAQMVRLLGPPPPELLQRSDNSSEYFDDNVRLIAAIDVPATSLQDAGQSLEEPNRQLFLDFIRRIARWLPEERPSAKELLNDPWLRTN